MTKETIELDRQAIARHWRQFPAIQSLFNAMASVENWTLDDSYLIREQIEELLAGLSSDEFKRFCGKPESIIFLLFYLKTPVAIYLYDELVNKSPELELTLQATAAAMLDDEHYGDAATVFFDRLRQIVLFETVESVFCQARLERVEKSLRHVQKIKGSWHE